MWIDRQVRLHLPGLHDDKNSLSLNRLGYSGIDLRWWVLDHVNIPRPFNPVYLFYSVVYLPLDSIKTVVLVVVPPLEAVILRPANIYIVYFISHWSGDFIRSQAHLYGLLICCLRRSQCQYYRAKVTCCGISCPVRCLFWLEVRDWVISYPSYPRQGPCHSFSRPL